MLSNIPGVNAIVSSHAIEIKTPFDVTSKPETCDLWIAGKRSELPSVKFHRAVNLILNQA